MSDYMSLPTDLPVPEDDGAADHLPGTAMPHIVRLRHQRGATWRSTSWATDEPCSTSTR